MNVEQEILNAFERGKAFGFAEGMKSMRLKELTDEEIHQAIRRGFARDGFLSDGIFLEIKELLRKAQEK